MIIHLLVLFISQRIRTASHCLFLGKSYTRPFCSYMKSTLRVRRFRKIINKSIVYRGLMLTDDTDDFHPEADYLSVLLDFFMTL